MAEKKSIAQIKEEAACLSEEGFGAFLSAHGDDPRSGVQKILEGLRKKQEALQRERERIEGLWAYEDENQAKGPICGIDEVGRGPLAGPVMACALILPRDCGLLYIDDSKALTAAKREELYDQILSAAAAVGLGSVSPERIDEINILQATFEAMREAVGKLSVQPGLLLVDAVHIPLLPTEQISIVKGDSKSISIAAASIVAKVTRDRLMEEMDALYPQYGFAKNKGYGSREHIEALKKYGPCPIHRRSFIGHFCGAD